LKWSQNSDGIAIDQIKLRNQVFRKMLSGIDKIIEAGASLTGDNTVGAKIVVALQHYCNVMEVLLLHRNLEAEEKELFQDNIDDFFELWLEIFGLDGMSNYIHLLSSGHV
jgi:hypothetical protein